MTLGYRAVLRLPDSVDAVVLAHDQVRTWLRRQKLAGSSRYGTHEVADWDGPGRHRLGPDAEMVEIRHDGSDGTRRLQLRHVETKVDGTWTVVTTAISGSGSRGPRQTLIIDLDAEGVDPDAVVDRAAPPNVVRGVLETVDVFDGRTRLVSKSRIVRAADVDELLAEITDPERTVAVAVAGAFEGAPVDRWADAVNSLLRNGLGVVVGAVLTPDAHEELVRRLPGSHAVPTHAIRTFEPGVNLDDVADGARHRVLGARTLERHIHRRGRGIAVDQDLQKLHARSSRQRFLARPLPADVARTMRLLDLASAPESPRTPIVTAEPAPSYSVEAPITSAQWDGTERRAELPGTARVSSNLLLGVRGLVHDLGGETLDLLGIADARREVKRLRNDSVGLDKFLDDAGALEAQLNETKAFLGLQEQETAKETTERQQLQRQVAFLQEQLRAVGEYDVHGRPEQFESETAGSVLELVESLQPDREGWADHVVFTGKIDYAAAVDDRDTGVALSSLKDFVHTLYDYAQTGYSGSMHAYLKDDSVQSFRCSFARWASAESQTVQNSPRLAGMRRFPVPGKVDPNGDVLMFAHFKVNGLGTFRPRLHYHDDTTNSGKVYIGYIGRHLETPGTN